MTIVKNENRFIQYELWKDCHNHCEFCYNRGQPSLNKIDRLNYVIEKLYHKEVDDFNEIGFIGGEFFDDQLENPKVKSLFYKLFEICADKIKNNKINKIYFTTALMYDKNNYLIPFLDYLRELGISDKCLLCTSYDTKYRFHTKEKEEMWKSNMKYLYENYNEIKLHTEIIVSQDFINKVLDESFSITKFKKEYHTGIDYIDPSSGFYFNTKADAAKELKDFFPTKSSFIKFLKKTVLENHEIALSTFLSMEVRSDRIYIIDNGSVLLNNRRDKDFKLVAKDKTKKFEFGFIDSDDSMPEVARAFGSLYA